MRGMFGLHFNVKAKITLRIWHYINWKWMYLFFFRRHGKIWTWFIKILIWLFTTTKPNCNWELYQQSTWTVIQLPADTCTTLPMHHSAHAPSCSCTIVPMHHSAHAPSCPCTIVPCTIVPMHHSAHAPSCPSTVVRVLTVYSEMLSELPLVWGAVIRRASVFTSVIKYDSSNH